MTATADVGMEEVNATLEGLTRQLQDVSALGRKVTPFDTDDLT